MNNTFVRGSSTTRFLFAGVVAAVAATSCDGLNDDKPPPPVHASAAPVSDANALTPVALPAGEEMVTVIANSTPPGAVVTGGNRRLGTTPLETEVPIPTPQAGQVETFSFTFEHPGYETAVINASPTGDTITIAAVLSPLGQPAVVAPVASAQPSGQEIRVQGHGGGAILDYQTTTGYAVAEQQCTMSQMSVHILGEHSYYRNLHIIVHDPSGHEYVLGDGGERGPFREHPCPHAVGREAQGRWTLTVEDRGSGDSGVLRDWYLTMHCR